METLLYTYLVIGLINALIIWWAAFNKDFDQFIRDEYREEPPNTKQKIQAIVSGIFIWPVHFYWALRS